MMSTPSPVPPPEDGAVGVTTVTVLESSAPAVLSLVTSSRVGGAAVAAGVGAAESASVGLVASADSVAACLARFGLKALAKPGCSSLTTAGGGGGVGSSRGGGARRGGVA